MYNHNNNNRVVSKVYELYKSKFKLNINKSVNDFEESYKYCIKENITDNSICHYKSTDLDQINCFKSKYKHLDLNNVPFRFDILDSFSPIIHYWNYNYFADLINQLVSKFPPDSKPDDILANYITDADSFESSFLSVVAADPDFTHGIGFYDVGIVFDYSKLTKQKLMRYGSLTYYLQTSNVIFFNYDLYNIYIHSIYVTVESFLSLTNAISNQWGHKKATSLSQYTDLTDIILALKDLLNFQHYNLNNLKEYVEKDSESFVLMYNNMTLYSNLFIKFECVMFGVLGVSYNILTLTSKLENANVNSKNVMNLIDRFKGEYMDIWNEYKEGNSIGNPQVGVMAELFDDFDFYFNPNKIDLAKAKEKQYKVDQYLHKIFFIWTIVMDLWYLSRMRSTSLYFAAFYECFWVYGGSVSYLNKSGYWNSIYLGYSKVDNTHMNEPAYQYLNIVNIMINQLLFDTSSMSDTEKMNHVDEYIELRDITKSLVNADTQNYFQYWYSQELNHYKYFYQLYKENKIDQTIFFKIIYYVNQTYYYYDDKDHSFYYIERNEDFNVVCNKVLKDFIEGLVCQSLRFKQPDDAQNEILNRIKELEKKFISQKTIIENQVKELEQYKLNQNVLKSRIRYLELKNY